MQLALLTSPQYAMYVAISWLLSAVVAFFVSRRVIRWWLKDDASLKSLLTAMRISNLFSDGFGLALIMTSIPLHLPVVSPTLIDLMIGAGVVVLVTGLVVHFVSRKEFPVIIHRSEAQLSS
ncbi:MAG: hypothetical protein EAX95_10115 [Candidatus Thorarchaeota archaeon]|nr:hypothetical protein [Candidatus Thorarchaeota archaeon]